MRTVIGMVLALGALAACGAETAEEAAQADQADRAGQAGATADSSAVLEGAPGDEERVATVESIVAFLRGEGSLDTATVAGTVMLRVTPEGGGETRRVARSALADRAGWRVGDVALAPSSTTLTELTTRPGTHFNCVEGSLGDVAPDLAGRPHVGAMLRPAEPQSCLQSWNATFVFDSAGAVVTDVVYDQWEW